MAHDINLTEDINWGEKSNTYMDVESIIEQVESMNEHGIARFSQFRNKDMLCFLLVELAKAKPVLDAAISFVKNSKVPFVRLGGTAYKTEYCRYTAELCEAVRKWEEESV